MKTKLGIAIALLALIGLAASAELQDKQSGMGAPSVEELATRLLQATYPGSNELMEVQLLPGELPQKMPADFPIPEGARIVGSRIQEDMGIDIVLDVSLTPNQTLEFYRNALALKNWTENHVWDRGFNPGAPTLTFCKGRRDPALTVTAKAQDNGTDLRLNIISDTDSSPCSWSGCSDDWLKPIPTMASPKGAKQSNENYMGGGPNVASVSAILETEMNSSSLANYYANLLKADNWTMKGDGHSGQSSWSTWSVEDDGLLWSGFLMALDLPGNENKRFVLVQASVEDI